MNVLIIENERFAAEKIAGMIKKADNSIVVTGYEETVEGAINTLQKELLPDLILMDIQLDDGLCFEIFETLRVDIPVIFTTAYDDYMLDAFKVNSVDYLLKPVDELSLRRAVEKFKAVHFNNTERNSRLINFLQGLKPGYKNRFLVKAGPVYKSVMVRDISCFYIMERAGFIRTFSDSDYAVDFSLDAIQKTVDPAVFFRINRDCIININAVSEIISYSSGRLKIRINTHKPIETLVVSRDKTSEFKRWMDR